MQIIRYPERELWPEILRRPIDQAADVEAIVRRIINDVKASGDEAVRRLTQDLDGVEIDSLAVDDGILHSAERSVAAELKAAIGVAKQNVESFHQAQIEEPAIVETMPGVTCWRRSVAIERVGLYVPAGTAPLFSTVLMLAIPAKIAGCREIVLCSPPDKQGNIAPEILFTAGLCGVDKIFRVGGAQAIAAMAYGTRSIPRVDKIFGPGNSYVTTAKQMVSKDVAIDMPAGPSELLIVADETSNPAFVAADLLSQAEHGADSQVMLVSTSESVIESVSAEIEKQMPKLPRADIARSVLWARARSWSAASMMRSISVMNMPRST